MKRIAAFFLAIVLIFALCACGKETAPEVQLSGGWSDEKKLTDDDIAIFEKAVKGTEYESLTPTALLGTQVVAGTNYKFLCTDADGAEKTVVVYRDLSDNCSVTSVE